MLIFQDRILISLQMFGMNDAPLSRCHFRNEKKFIHKRSAFKATLQQLCAKVRNVPDYSGIENDLELRWNRIFKKKQFCTPYRKFTGPLKEQKSLKIMTSQLSTPLTLFGPAYFGVSGI